MPRRRTIACKGCGHLVRKRDDECELCGATTPQASKRMTFALVKVALAAVAALGFWLYAKSVVIPSIGAG